MYSLIHPNLRRKRPGIQPLGIKQATLQSYYYNSNEELEHHLNDFLLAYNFARRLKALNLKTPWQFLQDQGGRNPRLFHTNIATFNMGLSCRPLKPASDGNSSCIQSENYCI